MKRINVFINNLKFEAELNDTKIAEEICKILPIESEGNTWGNEIYFQIPVAMKNENPTENIKAGDLAYWPEGNGFCIFYGRTPASTNDKPKPVSPVTIIGRIKGDVGKLKGLKEIEVRISKK